MSISFLGNNTSYIRVPNNDGLNFGTGDFTVEWFQYQTDTNTMPRIYQRGYPTNWAGFIILTTPAGYYILFDNTIYRIPINPYKNKWVHFAICRLAGRTTLYLNGDRMYWRYPDTYTYTNTEDLFIGNDSTLVSNKAFGGYLYYFHYIKGVAKYTSDFTVSTAMVSAIPETVLLITADGASGSLGHTICSNNIGTFDIKPPPPPPTTLPVNMKLMFTDNSRVYYKKGSLAPGGIGGVRNHRRKARKT
jgi:hypothetical protein